MLTFAGYTLTELLHEGQSTVIVRGTRNADHAKVVIKTDRSDFPTARSLAKLRHEHSLLCDLQGPGIVPVYSLETFGARLALVLEDQGLPPLDRLTGVSGARLDLGLVLRIVLEVITVLDRAHQRRILHHDLKPHNILVGTDPLRVRVIDWGIATRLSEVHRDQDDLQVFQEGTLGYIAPEQTGIVNRPVDARTDLYSLGVTFYELLTGTLPFNELDPAVLVYSHLTRMPLPPHQVEPRVPRQVSAIVMKLLAKSAEERYASARGLERDLLECLAQWERDGQIASFPCGQFDHSSDVRIPQKLYGRESELAAVLAAFHRAQQGAAELLVVTGYGGIGKSALVREARVTMRLSGARVVAGKFEQFRDAVPYASLVQALRELSRQILAERADALAQWKERLQAALAPNAGVLTQLVPELERVLGPQRPPALLGPMETQHRFHLVIQQFVAVFARAEQPLVLFFDDLQWAEPASLNVLNRLLTDPERKYLLIIGAYRDHDGDAIQLLTRTLDGITDAGGTIARVELRPLELSDVNRLIADTLHTPLPEVEALSGELHQKTQGNPFFLSQLITSLAQEKLIAFDAAEARWTWDLHAIAQQTVTDNVAEFMVQRLQRLRPATQELLKLAAALGAELDHDLLAQVAEQSVAACAEGLWDALVEGLLLSLDDDYQLLREMGDAPAAPSGQGGDAWAVAARVRYRFLHDRVQEAAYLLLEERDRPRVHLRIARLMRARCGVDVPDALSFVIVDHLNIGRALIRDRAERLAAAELNLRAGRRAKGAVAFTAARTYFSAGIAYLPEDAWESDFELSFELRIEYAELLFLDGDVGHAEALFEQLLERARAAVLQGEIQAMRLRLYTGMDRYDDALKIGRLALASLGAPLPDTAEASRAALDVEIQRVITRLGERTVQEWIEAPPMSDERWKTIGKLLLLSDVPSNAAGPDVSGLVSVRQVLLSLDHGPSELSAYGFASCALVMIRMFGKSRELEQLGQLAAAYQDRYPSPQYASKVTFLQASAVGFLSPVAEAASSSERAAQVCLQQGDIPYFQVAALHSHATYILCVDAELDTLKERTEGLMTLAQRAGNEAMLLSFTLGLQTIACLKGLTRDPCSFSDDRVDESALLARAREKNMGRVLSAYWAFKLMVLCLLGEHDAAIPMIEEVDAREAYLGHTHRAQMGFYISLHLCALIERAPAPTAARYEAMLDRFHRKLVERRALCEQGWGALDALVAAERARLRGQDMEAQRLYNQAIDFAQRDGSARFFALANELHGKFSLKSGFPRIARIYLSDAYHAWIRWGARTKAEALATHFAEHLILHPQERQSSNISSTTRRTSTAILQGVLFDLGEAMHAAHSISSEITGEQVIERFLRASCASSAARRVVVVLAQDDGLMIAGQFTPHPEVLHVTPGTPLAGSDDLAESVVRYVAQSHEAIALSSTDPADLFLEDPYIRDRRPRSLLCLPLIHQGRLVGVWYAESDAAGNLRKGSIELLQMLASQAASALANARLYEQLREASDELARINDDLEAEVAARTAELSEANQRVVQLEKDATETRMAGGFAHEMRNSLGSAGLFLSAAYTGGGKSLCTESGEALTELAARLRPHIPSEQLNPIATLIQRVSTSEQRLDTILGNTRDAVNRALQVTDVILEYSQLAHEQPGDEPVRLRALVELVLAEVTADLETHGITAQVGIAPGCTVRGSAEHLASILRHLVQNGRDALVDQKDTGPRELRVEGMEEPDRWVLRISDTGIGIAAKNRDRIFTPFFSTRPSSGRGLGLAMVEKLVRLYQGSIAFESEVGRGTTFTLVFPMSP